MCMIFISAQAADTVWEEIQKYSERDRVCEEDEKTKKRRKTEAAWFLPLPSQQRRPSSPPGYLMYTAELNIAYSITAKKNV